MHFQESRRLTRRMPSCRARINWKLREVQQSQGDVLTVCYPQQLAILSPATCAEEHTGVCEQYCSIWPENTQGSSVSELKKFGQNARSFYVRIAIQGKREKSRHSENRPAPQRRSQRVFALDHLGRPPDSPCRRMLQQQARWFHIKHKKGIQQNGKEKSVRVVS